MIGATREESEVLARHSRPLPARMLLPLRHLVGCSSVMLGPFQMPAIAPAERHLQDGEIAGIFGN